MAPAHITALFIGGPRDGESMLLPVGTDAVRLPRIKDPEILSKHDRVGYDSDIEVTCYVRRMMGLPYDSPVAVFAPGDMSPTELTVLLVNNYKNWRKA